VALRTELRFFAHAAPRAFVAAATCGRSCWCPQRSRPKACSTSVRRRPETAGAAGPRAGELLRRSVRPINRSPPPPAPRVARLRTCLLRAKLRRQIFSADHARQRLAGSDLPGVLPGQRHQGFYGSNIDSAAAGNGERYADSENAFAYRKALRADCTCNGRSPSGLAPVDLTLDTSLRSGDVVATTDGLVAYTGVRFGADQTAEFTPVASYPGLTADVRARLGEMKVAPVSAEMVAANAPLPETQTRRRAADASIRRPPKRRSGEVNASDQVKQREP
jgi:hypothetical protein